MYILSLVFAAELSNSATIRKAKLGLLFTPANPARLLVSASKTVAAEKGLAVGKSMNAVPFVEYWSRTYLLPVLLARWSQRMLMFCRPAVLTLNWTPAVLLALVNAG